MPNQRIKASLWFLDVDSRHLDVVLLSNRVKLLEFELISVT